MATLCTNVEIKSCKTYNKLKGKIIMINEKAIQEFEKSDKRFGTFIGKLFEDKPIRGAEIGVHQAIHSVKMLQSHSKLNFVGVDLWEKHIERNTKYLNSTGMLPAKFRDHKLATAWRYHSARVLQPFAGRFKLFCESSEENAERWDDEHFDFVYIDADHSYAGVISDIRLWWPKVKPGGMICGHDYACGGVTKALQSFFTEGVRHNIAHEKEGICWLRVKK